MQRLVIKGMTALAVASVLSCASTASYPFHEPRPLVEEQIERRIQDLEYLHGAELMSALDWLARLGEVAYSQLIDNLDHSSPTTRAGVANILGRGNDRRVIPYLQPYVQDSDPRMRYEVARALLRLGDWKHIPVLITGLRDQSEYVRALCNDALKRTTRLDFGFVASAPAPEREEKVRQWEAWWQQRQSDSFFTSQAAGKKRKN